MHITTPPIQVIAHCTEVMHRPLHWVTLTLVTPLYMEGSGKGKKSARLGRQGVGVGGVNLVWRGGN